METSGKDVFGSSTRLVITPKKRKCFPSGGLMDKISKRELCNQNAELDVRKKLEYLLVLDFEATCDKTKIQQEIIEFPCLKINLKTLQEESRFHHYVKPIVNPMLSIFCIELTGILQEMVENEKAFPEVLSLFEEWRKKEGLSVENSLYITSGDWDFGHMIPNQCKISNLQIPIHMMEWIDIKKLYANNFKNYHGSLIDIIKAFNLKFEGRLHSGIDDCLNIYNVVKRLALLGVEFLPTSKLELTELGHRVQVKKCKKSHSLEQLVT